MLLERGPTKPPVFERSHPLTNRYVPLKDGTALSAQTLAARFYESEIGQAMYEQPLRYSVKYGYDREMMNYDLGYDLCPIGHQAELPYHLGNIIEAEQAEGTVFGSLSEYEIGILMLTAQLHDIGETTHPAIMEAGLTPVGDIPAGRKTPIDRKNEAAVRQFLWNTMFDDVEPAALERVEAIIAHQDTSHLHDLFEAAHLVQTLETSNFAYHRLAEECWHKNGEVINPLDTEGIRASALLGIARIPYMQVQKDVARYYHLAHVRATADSTTKLRFPAHELI